MKIQLQWLKLNFFRELLYFGLLERGIFISDCKFLLEASVMLSRTGLNNSFFSYVDH
jgi:hypothetical protein